MKKTGWPLGYEERKCWANWIVHAVSLQDFQTMWSWSTNVTDKRTTCNRKIAGHPVCGLCCRQAVVFFH